MKETRLPTVLLLVFLCLPSLAFAAEPAPPAMEPAMAAPTMAPPAAMAPDMAAPMAAVPAMEPVMEAVMAAPMEPAMAAVMAAPMALPRTVPADVSEKLLENDAKLEAAAAAKAAAKPAPAVDATVPPATTPVTAPTVTKSTTEATPVPAVKAVSAEKKAPWWKVLFSGVLNILLLFVGALATGVGALLIKWLAKRMKVADVDILVGAEKLYNDAVAIGINYAEQAARKLGGTPEAKSQRLKTAIDKVCEVIKDMGLAEKTTEWITNRIEAKLGELNVGKPFTPPPEPPKATEEKK